MLVRLSGSSKNLAKGTATGGPLSSWAKGFGLTHVQLHCADEGRIPPLNEALCTNVRSVAVAKQYMAGAKVMQVLREACQGPSNVSSDAGTGL